ncbi:MAG: hypothetical protein HQL44_08825 [Alphaproteobacteria bacterium]|nr:hypothetical protein [Alphaproteobacteria bacterium]
MRNPIKPESSGNIFADMLGYKEILFEELPDAIKQDFADMMQDYARQGLKPRIYRRPDGLYSLMADPEPF